MATASYQPYYVGQTFPIWQIPLTTGGKPENLTGVDITKFTLYFRNLNGVETAGTGTITLLSAYPAYISYKAVQADVTSANASFVAGAFNGTVFVTAFYPPSGTSADEAIFDPVPFVIKPRGLLL